MPEPILDSNDGCNRPCHPRPRKMVSAAKAGGSPSPSPRRPESSKPQGPQGPKQGSLSRICCGSPKCKTKAIATEDTGTCATSRINPARSYFDQSVSAWDRDTTRISRKAELLYPHSITNPSR